jgi:hypothetical protein
VIVLNSRCGRWKKLILARMTNGVEFETTITTAIFERVMQRNLAFGGKLHKLSLGHAAKPRCPAERNRAFVVLLQS